MPTYIIMYHDRNGTLRDLLIAGTRKPREFTSYTAACNYVRKHCDKHKYYIMERVRV